MPETTSPIIQGKAPLHYIDMSPFAGLVDEEKDVAESVQQTMVNHGLDWTVEKQTMFLKDGREVPDRKAIVQQPGGAILGTAGKLFTPIQNLDAFSTLQYAIDNFGAHVETAGALSGGSRVWMLLGLPQKGRAEVAKGDEVKPYFLVSNAHTSERSQSLQARFTSIRVVCQNTLDAAIRADRAAVSIPHHKNGKDRLKEIEDVVARMYEVHKRSIQLYRDMLKTPVTQEEVAQYLVDLFRLRDREEDSKLTQLISKKGSEEVEQRLSKVFEAREVSMYLLDNGKGTGRNVWGAYNAVTEYIDHVSILKKNGALTKNGHETAAFGYGAYQKQQALDLALARWMKSERN